MFGAFLAGVSIASWLLPRGRTSSKRIHANIADEKDMLGEALCGRAEVALKVDFSNRRYVNCRKCKRLMTRTKEQKEIDILERMAKL